MRLLSLASCKGSSGGGGGGGGGNGDGTPSGVPPIAGDGNGGSPDLPGFVLPIASLAISAGSSYTCAIVEGKAWCWGDNLTGKLGDNSLIGKDLPVAVVQTPADTTAGTDAVLLDSGVARISAGNRHTCAIVDGTAKCWGGNDDGQLGNNSFTSSSTPVQVSGLVSDVLAISAGKEHTCVVHNGAAKCWGNNQEGRLGDNTVTTLTNLGVVDPNNNNNRMMPVQVSGLVSDVTVISAGDSHTCAIHDGAAKCWGNNEDGRLGDDSITNIASGGITAIDANRKVPEQVMGLVSDVTAISAGEKHTCAIHSGAAKCWGKNNLGQLGTTAALAAVFL